MDKIWTSSVKCYSSGLVGVYIPFCISVPVRPNVDINFAAQAAQGPLSNHVAQLPKVVQEILRFVSRYSIYVAV